MEFLLCCNNGVQRFKPALGQLDKKGYAFCCDSRQSSAQGRSLYSAINILAETGGHDALCHVIVLPILDVPESKFL